MRTVPIGFRIDRDDPIGRSVQTAARPGGVTDGGTNLRRTSPHKASDGGCQRLHDSGAMGSPAALTRLGLWRGLRDDRNCWFHTRFLEMVCDTV